MQSHLQNLSKAIQFKTITSDSYNQDQLKEFFKLHKFIETAYPLVHQKLNREVINQASLLYTWQGTNQESSPSESLAEDSDVAIKRQSPLQETLTGRDQELKKPILFLAHQDVIPVDEETIKDWQHPPFSGEIKDGYIWGRGALDMKHALIGVFEAVENLLKDGYRPPRTVYLAFGHDEESGGRQGAQKIYQVLKERQVELDCIIDEGGGILEGFVPGIKQPIAMIGIAEKQTHTFSLSIKTTGGHTSIPDKNNAIHTLCQAVVKLNQKQMPARITKPLKDFAKALSKHAPIYFKPILHSEFLLKKFLARSEVTNSLIRSIITPSKLRANTTHASQSSQAEVLVDVRVLPSQDLKDIQHFIIQTINNPKIQVKLFRQSHKPDQVSPTNTSSYRLLKDLIKDFSAKAIPAPLLVPFSTDSSYFSSICPNIYRFHPLLLTPQDRYLPHGVNERISIQNFENTIRFYKEFMVRYLQYRQDQKILWY